MSLEQAEIAISVNMGAALIWVSLVIRRRGGTGRLCVATSPGVPQHHSPRQLINGQADVATLLEVSDDEPFWMCPRIRGKPVAAGGSLASHHGHGR